MRLMIDANVLVAEMMRIRGRALIADPRLEIFAAERAWDEAQYEHRRRVAAFVRHNRVTSDAATTMIDRAFQLVDTNVGIVSEEAYGELEALARARIPRDPDDWHTVALAQLLNAGIWTNDGDFLGCGCATWVTETLLAELTASSL